MNITHEQHQWLVEQSFKKLARDYGLGDSDYQVRYRLHNRFNWKIVRRASEATAVVFLTHSIKYPDFELMARAILTQVRRVKATKGTDIELYSGLQKRDSEIAEQYKAFNEITPVLSLDEVEETVEHVVSVRHNATGLIVRKSCKFGEIRKTLLAARIDLSELVEMVKQEQARAVVISETTKPAAVSVESLQGLPEAWHNA